MHNRGSHGNVSAVKDGGPSFTHDRDISIDLLRCAGVIAIVAGHIWDSHLLRMLIYTWHVPIFFYLSGWLSTPHRGLRGEIRARFRSLVRPYLFWFIILYILYIVDVCTPTVWAAGGPGLQLLSPIYGGIHATQPFTTFWFTFALFGATLLWRAFANLPKWAHAVVFTCALAATMVSGPLLASTPLGIGSALPALVFFYAGAVSRRLQNQPIAILIGVPLAALAIVANTFLDVAQPLDIKQGNWGTPVLSVTLAMLICWCLTVSSRTLINLPRRRTPRRARTSHVSEFALCAYVVILTHPAVLWLTDRSVPPLVCFVLAILIPTIVAVAARHTPMSGWMTGTPRKEVQIPKMATDERSRRRC